MMTAIRTVMSILCSIVAACNGNGSLPIRISDDDALTVHCAANRSAVTDKLDGKPASAEIHEWFRDQVVSERHQWKLQVASVAPGECVVRGVHFEVHAYHDSIGVVLRNGDVDKTYWREQFGAADAVRSRQGIKQSKG
jgi:hypothetical protein